MVVGTKFGYWPLWYDCGKYGKLLRRQERARSDSKFEQSEKLDRVEKFPIDQTWALETGKHGYLGSFEQNSVKCAGS